MWLSNEADVREEIAAPLLAALGYKRGTSANISREVSLTYERDFLGHKKASDPPLRGRADYVLSVAGAGRWILETKPPSDALDVDAIGQAITYARHPEVAASYAVLLNGLRLTVHHVTQPATAPPLIDIEVGSPTDLASQLEGVLSPAAIRRDCSPPAVDIAKPLAEGFRSAAAVRGGKILHAECTWSSNVQLPPPARTQFDEMRRRLSGFQVAITGGSVWRDESSRVRAKLAWAMPHDELLRFALDKNLLNVEYVALSDRISPDPNAPTIFDVVGTISISAGERIYDVFQWRSQTAGVASHMIYQGQATGYINGGTFQGRYIATYLCTYPLIPALELQINLAGTFVVELDP